MGYKAEIISTAMEASMNENALPDLIGVVPTEDQPLDGYLAAGFVYSVDAPAYGAENLWASCFALDGSVVATGLVTRGLNQLFSDHADLNPSLGESFPDAATTLVLTANEDVQLKFSVGGLRHSGADDTQAFMTTSLQVREVVITVEGCSS